MITLQVVANMEIALEEGAAGVFIINHDFDYPQMLPILRQVRGRFPLAFIGVNFHTVNGAEAFPILGRLAREGVKVDAYWADNACIEHASAEQPSADMIAETRLRSAWDGLYFGGTAFKNPRQHQVRPCTRTGSRSTLLPAAPPPISQHLKICAHENLCFSARWYP